MKPTSSRFVAAEQLESQATPERQKKAGRLVVQLVDQASKPFKGKAVVFALEHRALFAPQHRLESNSAGSAAGALPAGEYSVQAVAEGYTVGRAVAVVRPGEATELKIALTAGRVEPAKYEDRLRVYDLEPAKLELQDLRLKPGEFLSLNANEFRDRRSYTIRKPATIADMKRWIGTPEGVFGHEKARFGPVPKLDIAKGASLEMIDRSMMPALRAVANEYVHGNSKSVAKYEPFLNALLAARDDFISIFHFFDVWIDDGAVLEIGNNSNVFACNILHIHQNGTLSVVGDVRADIGSYRVFP